MCLLHSAGDWPGPMRYLSFWSLLRYLQDRDCTSSISHPHPQSTSPKKAAVTATHWDSSLLPMPAPPALYFLLHLGGNPSPCMDPPSAVPILPAPVSLLLLGAAPPRVACGLQVSAHGPTPLWVVMWAYCVPDPAVGPFTKGRFVNIILKLRSSKLTCLSNLAVSLTLLYFLLQPKTIWREG